MQAEIQKQLRMMPGQEKILQEYYQNNPSVLANLRGQLYEEKILKEIKAKAKSNLKEITKEEADKLLKEENEKHMKEHSEHEQKNDHSDKEKGVSKKNQPDPIKSKTAVKKTPKLEKVQKYNFLMKNAIICLGAGYNQIQYLKI